MKTIGFSGGDLVVELGTVNDFSLFFQCINNVTKLNYPDEDWDILVDRLYKRYLRLEELSLAKEKMNRVRDLFSIFPSTSIDWDHKMIVCREKSWINPNQAMLSDIFKRYFEAFLECVESAEINYQLFNSYQGYEYEAVKTVISDLPWFIEDKNRPLEQYDALGPDDLPFWLR
ncbi:hypothetical protein [Pectobacterium sp. A5351]|uniref:hypothetical protein n=1 Tax=Pectobacterium sp. A5351 TaxID=2914983 RepID=UPI00232C1D1E|nr:hypothetical protein [Pectobacterium sp. A5351]WCG83206.1 hypothetical protein O1Q74_00325 [Pectobacterium sp. A5351]